MPHSLPAPIAITFLSAPHSSTVTISSHIRVLKTGADNSEATAFATFASGEATVDSTI